MTGPIVPSSADARGGEGSTTLWRAVHPAELADIEAIGVFRNLGAAEGKYFSTTAEGAASYAKQAFYGFKDPLIFLAGLRCLLMCFSS
jgi:hypothetical protein